MMKDLYNKEARIKYSKLYFGTLSKIVNIFIYFELLESEQDETRKKLHTHEYWWIKYKMAKRYEELNGCLYDEDIFAQYYKKFKVCRHYAKKIVDLYHPGEDHLKNSIAYNIYLLYGWDGIKLYDLDTKLPFSPALYHNQREVKSEALSTSILSQKEEVRQEAFLPFVEALSQLITNCTYDESPLTEIEKSLIDPIIEKYDLLNGKFNYYRNLFNTYYCSKTVKIDFEYAYKKYGEELFDFLGHFSSNKLDAELSQGYQSSNEIALHYLVKYYSQKALEIIRNYEVVFKKEIIVDSKKYWDFISNELISHFKYGDELSDTWWIDNSGNSLSSKIALVPQSVFEDLNNQLNGIQVIKR